MGAGIWKKRGGEVHGRRQNREGKWDSQGGKNQEKKKAFRASVLLIITRKPVLYQSPTLTNWSYTICRQLHVDSLIFFYWVSKRNFE